jgi:Phage integrase, N-terminal SAM-like domain
VKTAPLASTAALPASIELEKQATVEVREFIRAEKSENTRRSYRSDCEILAEWCTRRGFRCFPLASGQLAEFLAHQAGSGVKAMTLYRRVAAIRHAHRALELPDPFDQLARSTLAGIRNKLGVSVEPHAPLLAQDLLKIILAIPFDGGESQ